MGWWKTAKPGDKVVFVNTEHGEASYSKPTFWQRLFGRKPVPYFSDGAVHVVSDIFAGEGNRLGVWVRLRGHEQWRINPVFLRPVERDRTSAEVEKLKRLLNVSPADIEVNA